LQFLVLETALRVCTCTVGSCLHREFAMIYKTRPNHTALGRWAMPKCLDIGRCGTYFKSFLCFFFLLFAFF
jgi:hypothetical protein